MSSPRRRSSFRKKADEETPRKGRPEKGEGSKENTEKRREVARSVGLRAIGAAGKGREKKEVEDRMGHQKGVESSGKESDQGATTRSVATGGKVKGDDASESKLTDLRVGSKSGKEHEMLGKGGQEGSVGVESVETSESAAVPYEALPGIGDLGVGPSDIDKCQSAVCAGTVPDCPEGSLVSPVLKVEAVDEADSPSPVNGDPSDSCKVAGFSSAETPFRKGTSAVRSETSGGCRASEEDLSEEPSVGDKLPERSEREAVEYSSASAPQETSFESHPPIIEPSSKSLEIQLDRALSTRESSSELEPSESTRDGQNGISEIDKHNEGDVAERSDSKPSSPNLAGPTGLAGQSLDRSSGISRTEPASSAIDSLTLIPSVSSQTELGPLIRFEQIFTRFAPGTVLSKEETARPGPALQQFFKVRSKASHRLFGLTPNSSLVQTKLNFVMRGHKLRIKEGPVQMFCSMNLHSSPSQVDHKV